MLWCDRRPRLIDLFSNNLLQCRLQEMCCRMIARRGEFLDLINLDFDLLTDRELTFLNV